MNKTAASNIGVGFRIGKLTVESPTQERKNGYIVWLCRCDCGGSILLDTRALQCGAIRDCDCGKENVVGQTLLQSGKTKSCGCLQAASIVKNLKLCEGTSVAIPEASGCHLLPTNTSEYTGVYQNRRSGKWCAQITFKRKTYYLGSYDRLEDAVAARRHGEEMYDDFIQWYYTTHKRTERRA
jgi:hypothetical protein